MCVLLTSCYILQYLCLKMPHFVCFLAHSLIYFGAEEKKNFLIVATSGSLVVPGQTCTRAGRGGCPGRGHNHSPKECCGSTSAACPVCTVQRSTCTCSSEWANLCQQTLAAGMEGGEAEVGFPIRTGTRPGLNCCRGWTLNPSKHVSVSGVLPSIHEWQGHCNI